MSEEKKSRYEVKASAHKKGVAKEGDEQEHVTKYGICKDGGDTPLVYYYSKGEAECRIKQLEAADCAAEKKDSE